MIGEAVDTAITLGWALAAWIIILTVASGLTLLLTAWTLPSAACRAVSAALAASRAVRALGQQPDHYQPRETALRAAA